MENVERVDVYRRSINAAHQRSTPRIGGDQAVSTEIELVMAGFLLSEAELNAEAIIAAKT